MFAKIYDPMFAKSDKGAKAEPFINGMQNQHIFKTTILGRCIYEYASS